MARCLEDNRCVYMVHVLFFMSVVVDCGGSPVGMFCLCSGPLLKNSVFFFSLGVFEKYVVCLCRGCDGCLCFLFCNCEAWSCRCSCMGSVSVFRHADVCMFCCLVCILWQFLNAAFLPWTCSLLMLVEDAIGGPITEEAYSRAGLINCFYR